jgi:hypothetical protein
MKKLITVFTLALTLMAGCKKSDLQILNPNSPTPGSALPTQTGLEEFALGMWTKAGTSGNNWLTYSLVNHSIMGDEQWASVGNFGWRYANQVNTITLPAPYNNVVPNVFGVTQQVQLKSLNNLVSANANQSDVNVWEWNLGYFLNGEANQLLLAISTNKVVSPAEKNVIQAFAYFWKGLAYSRLGSMYISGVISNATDGNTNGNYVAHDALVTEGNANFDKAIALLGGIANTDATYTATMKVINPAFCSYPTNAAMWIREMYTYEARNAMVNKKVAATAAADWTAVQALANKGLIAGDVTFGLGMDPAGTSDLSATQQHPYEWGDYVGQPGWTFMSERLVQDFKPGDARFTKGVALIGSVGYVPGNAPEVNRSSRGIQFGTRYVAALIELGGYWATNAHKGIVQFAGSYEENALMLAEASIRTGAIDPGLAYIDQVRTANGAGLAAVSGTGLNLANALEELRRERRIALYLRGLAFYDARRWGVTAPASAGGGRANCVVLVPNSIFLTPTSAGYTVMNCFMDYNYMDYWDVPATEFSYNPPSAGSAAIAN